jgi:hypothetical protein
MDNSFAVRQFFALVKGENPVGDVINRVDPVRMVETKHLVCFRCHTVGDQDVIRFQNGMNWRVCRCCRAIHENNVLTGFALMDNGAIRVVEVM